MPGPCILTIDLGTSGPKAAVVDVDGNVLGAARGSVTTTFTADGGAEQDAEAIWATTLTAAGQALAEAAIERASIVAVVVSSQYSSIVPVAHDGTPTGPMLTWMDHRGAPKRLAKLPGYPKDADSKTAMLHWFRVHGLPPIDGGIALTHMRWIRFARPEVYAATAFLLEPSDYLTMRFSGRATANQCSSYMQLLTDNRTTRAPGWDPRLVEESLIDPAKLATFVPVGSEVGPLVPDVAATLGLPPTTVVLSGINDTQAGAMAAGAFTGDHAGLTVGTTSVITTHVAKKKTDPLNSLYTMPSPIGDCYLLSAENGVAGVAVDDFLDTLVYPDDGFSTPLPEGIDRYDAFTDAARAAGAGAHGVLFLPWLKGSLAPKADSRMRGGFLGVGLDTTRNDLARAVLEGVALNLRWMRGPVERFTKRPISHFTFFGGGARSDLWPQIMADVLAVPVHQMANAGYANSLGTALFGFERLGLLSVDEVATRASTARVYEPDPDAARRYDELAEVFTDAFKRTRPLMRSLGSVARGPSAAG